MGMQPDARRLGPAKETQSQEIIAATTPIRILPPPPDVPADIDALPSSVDLAIRRHIESILSLLRPRCSRCSHPISSAKSIRLGMGPTCRRAVGA